MTLKEKQIFLLLASAKWNVPILEDRLTTEEIRLTLPIPYLEKTENRENVIDNVPNNVLDNVLDNVLKKLTERQRIIYDIIKRNVL